MYDYLQRSDRQWEKRLKKDDEKEMPPKGYVAADYEKCGDERLKERMLFENSYGSLSLGISGSGNMAFVVSGKKDMKENPATAAARSADGGKITETSEGVFADSAKSPLTAVVYKKEIKTKRQREQMLARMREMLEETDSKNKNDTLKTQLPFLYEHEDRAALKQLNELDVREISAAGQMAVDQKKAKLAKEISVKRQLKQDVMQGVTAALRMPVKKKDGGALYFMQQAALVLDDGDADDSEDECQKKEV